MLPFPAVERGPRADRDPPTPLELAEAVHGRATLPPTGDVFFEMGFEFRGVCFFVKFERRCRLASFDHVRRPIRTMVVTGNVK